MLTSAHYKCWQCHKDKLIEFDRVTTIVGDNGSGKSALIRGIRWAALNQWDDKADRFITFGEHMAEVELVFDDCKVTRSKGGDGNVYLLNGKELRAFGAGKVPDDVSKALSLTEDNFQNQKDPAFWLWLNGPDAAKALNKIFSLEEIDDCMAAVAAELRQAKSSAAVIEQRLEEAKQVVLLTDWVDEADRGLVELEQLDDQIGELIEEIGREEDLLDIISTKTAYVDKANGVLALGEECVRLEEGLSEITSGIEKCHAILTQQEELCQLQKQLAVKQPRLDKLQKQRCPLCGRK
jgi:chromosome segregation ATPase